VVVFFFFCRFWIGPTVPRHPSCQRRKTQNFGRIRNPTFHGTYKPPKFALYEKFESSCRNGTPGMSWRCDGPSYRELWILPTEGTFVSHTSTTTSQIRGAAEHWMPQKLYVSWMAFFSQQVGLDFCCSELPTACTELSFLLSKLSVIRSPLF
jgi:hypothetical protein